MRSFNQARGWAVEILERVRHGAYSNLVLNQVLRRHQFRPADVRLLTRLVYGTLQHKLTLQYYLSPFVKDLSRVPDFTQILLETAVYQLRYLSRIPNHAVLNESIQIAKQRETSGQRRLVTGVLHQILRSGLPGVNRIHNSLHRRAVKFSVPEWIIKNLSSQLGDAKAKSILKVLNKPARQSVRVNRHLVTDRQLANELRDAGYRVAKSRLAEAGFVVSGRPVYHSSAFKAGRLAIQDESAMLPVQSMSIKPSDLVLDACAAPGGKTCQIAERLSLQRGGKVIALDRDAKRLKLVQRNARRMKLASVVEVHAMDARQLSRRFRSGIFDQILVDAPCSGLGLMQRKPDIRYFRTPADVARLSRVQLAILRAAAPVLKVGGQLTYSTCTILNQENLDVIKSFLADNSNFKIKPIVWGSRARPVLKIYPDDFGSDGFFVCDLVKTRE